MSREKLAGGKQYEHNTEKHEIKCKKPKQKKNVTTELPTVSG